MHITAESVSERIWKKNRLRFDELIVLFFYSRGRHEQCNRPLSACYHYVHRSNEVQNGDILVLADPSPPGNMEREKDWSDYYATYCGNSCTHHVETVNVDTSSCPPELILRDSAAHHLARILQVTSNDLNGVRTNFGVRRGEARRTESGG